MDTIVLLSDGWGPSSGGINAFNYSLCKAMGQQYGKKLNVVCVSFAVNNSEIDNMLKNGLKLISMLTAKDFNNAGEIVSKLVSENLISESGRVIWIGHDIYTGDLALECKKLVNGSLCAIIHHMAYKSYYPIMNNDPVKIQDKEQKQEILISKADYIFANGPSLFRSACDLCETKEDTVKVHQIVAGLAEINPKNFAAKNLSVIAFGRIEEKENNNNSIIKQVMLAVAAWGTFLKDYNKNHRLQSSMLVIGYSTDNIENENKKLKKFVSSYSAGTDAITAYPYTEDQEKLYNMLKNQSLSLMLSREEGFGLVGLESISAGVPVIISKQMGLYEFLENKRLENRVMSVNIQGSFEEPYFSDEDLKCVVEKMYEYSQNPEKWKKNALDLRERLIEQSVTWERCAEEIISICLPNIKKRNSKSKSKNGNTFSWNMGKGDLGIVQEINSESRICRFTERKWFDREDVYQRLDEEWDDKDWQVLLVKGPIHSGKVLTVFEWLKRKGVRNQNILCYQIHKDEDANVLFDHWELYCSENMVEKETFLFIDNFPDENYLQYYSVIMRMIKYYGYLKIIIFSETAYHEVSEMKQYYNIGIVTIGSLNEKDALKYFEMYQINHINEDDIKIMKPTGYLPGLLKKCVNYILLGLSVKEAIDNCMTKDYAGIIQLTPVEDLSKDDKKLAEILSMFEDQFSKKITQIFIEKFDIEKNSLTNLLEKGILVNNSEFSYFLEPFYRSYFTDKLDFTRKKEVCREIARYYYLTFRYGIQKNTSSPNTIMCGMNACKYLQAAGDYEVVQKLMYISKYNIYRNALNAGYFENILSIFMVQYRNMEINNYWFIYNYLHCLTITGKYTVAESVLRDFAIEDIPDYDCKIGILRLRGELMYEHQSAKDVLIYLEENYNRIKDDTCSHACNNQLEMLIVNLLIAAEEYDKVEIICREKIKKSQTRNSGEKLKETRNKDYMFAVAATNLIIKQKVVGEDIDYKLIDEILKCFTKLNDERGKAWILGVKGEIDMMCKLKDAETDICKSIEKRSKMHESSKEYRLWLSNIKSKTDNRSIRKCIAEEERRLGITDSH